MDSRMDTQKLTLTNIVMITLIYHVWIKVTTLLQLEIPTSKFAHIKNSLNK